MLQELRLFPYLHRILNMKMGGILISILMSFLITGAPEAEEAVEQGELLFPRYAPSAVTDGEWIYVYGGAPHGGRNGADFMRQGLHASIERIDPVTLKSEYFNNALHRRANHASVYFNQQMVSCGGRSQVGLKRPKMSACEFLDLNEGVFRELPELPIVARSLGMTEVSGNLYVLGGLTADGTFSKRFFRLPEGGIAWEPLPDAPIEREGPILAIGNKIFALGGYNGQTLRSVMVFDIKRKAWEQKAELPVGFSAYSAIADGSFIYLFGDYKRMDTICRYETESGDLYLLDQKMTPRRHTAAVRVANKAVVIGGNQTSSGAALKVIESFELSDLRTGGKKLKAE